jgi:hypothetical protein
MQRFDSTIEVELLFKSKHYQHGKRITRLEKKPKKNFVCGLVKAAFRSH